MRNWTGVFGIMQIQTIDLEEVVKALEDYELKRLFSKMDRERLIDNFILKWLNDFNWFCTYNAWEDFEGHDEYEWFYTREQNIVSKLYYQLEPIRRATLGRDCPSVYYKRIKNVIFLVF